jgi:hypothetical protein
MKQWKSISLALSMIACSSGTSSPDDAGVPDSSQTTALPVAGAVSLAPPLAAPAQAPVQFAGSNAGGAGVGGAVGYATGGAAGFAEAGASGARVAMVVAGAPPPPPACSSISAATGVFNPCEPAGVIAYSPDGQLLAIGGERLAPPNLLVYRMSDGALVHALDGIGREVYDISFSPDGNSIAVAGAVDGAGGDIVKLYDANSGEQLRSFPATCGFYSSSAAFSPDGSLLATGGYTGPIEIWRVSDATRVASIPYPTSVERVHFAPNGAAIIVAGYDARAVVFAVPSGEQLLELSPTSDETADAAYSPDGTLIATTGPNNDVQLWDASGMLLQRVPSHTQYVGHVLWLDDDHIVSADWSGVVTWMNRQPSGEFAVGTSFSGGLGIAISPDRTTLAVSQRQGDQLGFGFVAIDPLVP